MTIMDIVKKVFAHQDTLHFGTGIRYIDENDAPFQKGQFAVLFYDASGQKSKRLAACWNALAHLTDEQIEAIASNAPIVVGKISDEEAEQLAAYALAMPIMILQSDVNVGELDDPLGSLRILKRR